METNKNKLNATIASKVIEISEHPSYLELTDRVFYYDAPNANGVQIDFDEDSYVKAETLVDMPVVALYLSDKEGKPTFGGHAVTRTKDGVHFGTSAIGVHTNVWIEDAEIDTVDGEHRVAKCLFSTMKIWSRYTNMVAAVKRLFSEGRLHNSWEIAVGSYKYEDNVKKLLDYEFIGNALLGEAIPAYGSTSKVLSMASLDDEDPKLLIAEALSADLVGGDSASNINNQLDNSESDRKEMTPKMEANDNVIVENSEEITTEEAVETVDVVESATTEEIEEVEEATETVEETAEVSTEEVVDNEEAEVSEEDPVPDETEVESSEEAEAGETDNTDAEMQETSVMKTDSDINKLIWKAVDQLRDDEGNWFYVSMLFPEEHIVLVQSYKMPSLKHVQYSYRIEEDKVILENRKEVQMTISPLNINSEIESKNSAIADANSRIVELENQNAELVKAKEELDQIKKDKEEAEHAEAINRLREYVVKSGRFTEEEIASEAVQKAINELNETWIKAEIADRFVASMAESNDNKNCKNVETSETNGNLLSVVLSESNEEKSATKEDVMRAFFNRN